MEVIQTSQKLEEKIKAAETLEDVVNICSEEGIAVTKEQLEAALAQTEGGELSEDVLDNVSGGTSMLWRALIPIIGGPLRPISPIKPINPVKLIKR